MFLAPLLLLEVLLTSIKQLLVMRNIMNKNMKKKDLPGDWDVSMSRAPVVVSFVGVVGKMEVMEARWKWRVKKRKLKIFSLSRFQTPNHMTMVHFRVLRVAAQSCPNFLTTR